MKLKSDYVTNSSSASFIMYITSTIDDIDEFREFLEGYIKHESGEYGAGAKSNHVTFIDNPEIDRISNGVYVVKQYTVMYNGFEDIPSWMIDLMVRKSLTQSSYEDKLPREIIDIQFDVDPD